MTKAIPFALFFTMISAFLFATNEEKGVIVIEGKYQKRNIYVKNGFGSSGVGFCAYEVAVNGEKTTDEVNSSAFEIDLSLFNFKFGEKVIVEIKHKENCLPLIINPEALKPVATFEIVEMSIDGKGELNWKTKSENGSLPFIIQQFRWNKWVKVGEVQGTGNPEISNYSFQTEPHSGENRYRVKQVGYGPPRYSQAVSYVANVPSVTMTLDNEKNPKLISFSQETLFEVYDLFGTVVKRGFGTSLDVGELKKGKYYISYDNATAEFSKKK